MKDKRLTSETFRVPLDMVLDIFQLVVKQKLNHQITNVNMDKCQIEIRITARPSESLDLAAIKAIDNLLGLYNDLRFSDHDEINQ